MIEDAWKYDINSSYPSIYSDVHFMIPIKRGEFKKLTSTEFKKMYKSFFNNGIYKVKITYPDDNNTVA